MYIYIYIYIYNLSFFLKLLAESWEELCVSLQIMSTMQGGCSEMVPVRWRSLSLSSCSDCGVKGLFSNLIACFHIITAFPSSPLLSMLSKMFYHVLTEPVALIIYSVTPLLPSCLAHPSQCWFITHYIFPSTDLIIIITYVSLVMRYTW